MRLVHHPVTLQASICNVCETPGIGYLFLPKVIRFRISHLWRCPLLSGSGHEYSPRSIEATAAGGRRSFTGLGGHDHGWWAQAVLE